MLVQVDAMTLVAPMVAGYDSAAMGGRFISPANPTQSASAQVNDVPVGTYYRVACIAEAALCLLHEASP
jgi:hypothetical protein